MQISTSCSKCVFAESHSGFQSGCKLGRLDKFRQMTSVHRHVGDSHFTIENKICNTKRVIEWLQKQQKENNEPKAAVLREVKIRYDMIINITHESVDEIVTNCIWNAGQAIKPRHIFLLADTTYSDF